MSRILPIDDAAADTIRAAQGIHIEQIARDDSGGPARYRVWITWGHVSFRAQISVSADAQCGLYGPSFNHMNGMVIPAPIVSETNTTATGSLSFIAASPYVRIADDASMAQLRRAAETWYWAQEHDVASKRAEYAAQRRAAL